MLIKLTAFTQTYKIVDPAQIKCFDNTSTLICPSIGQSYYGQDSQYDGNMPSYVLSTDTKTVYDNNTELTWMSSPNMTNTPPVKTDRMTFTAAQSWVATVNAANYGGFNDWRIPTIKEIYSLYIGNGHDPGSTVASTDIPYIDTNYFKFAYGNTAIGERTIDQQYLSSNVFVLNPSGSGYPKDFAVNFSDGRIKGYDMTDALSGLPKTFYVQLVRGTITYGYNNFVDNTDQTITDQSTGLMWTKNDNGSGLNWLNALAWVQTQNNANFLGYNDWRMPDIKELQSIIDYTHSPDFDNLPAINLNYFNCSSIINEAGQADYPYFWSSTTHEGFSTVSGGGDADYIPFGRALGWPATQTSWIDVHGAGAQRCDPKKDPPFSYATVKTVIVGGITYTGYSWGPQGDAIRGANYVRLVRNNSATGVKENINENPIIIYPNPVLNNCSITFNKNYNQIKIELYNSLGCKVKEIEKYDSKTFDINLTSLPKGLYIVKLYFDNNLTTNKILKL